MSRKAPHLQHEVLETLSDARNYNAWLAEVVQPYLGEDPIEVGAGIGTYTQLWLDRGVPRLTATDIDDFALETLELRFRDDDRVTVEMLDLNHAPQRLHSGLAALNVLEHIPDDVAALQGAARLVRPGGIVAVVVPAFSFAMSAFDRSIGHVRRYTVRSLDGAFRRAGLDPTVIRYLNAPGLLAWMVAMKLCRLAPRDGRAVRAWDAVVVPPTRALERRVGLPFGQSVVGFARVPPRVRSATTPRSVTAARSHARPISTGDAVAAPRTIENTTRSADVPSCQSMGLVER